MTDGGLLRPNVLLLSLSLSLFSPSSLSLLPPSPTPLLLSPFPFSPSPSSGRLHSPPPSKGRVRSVLHSASSPACQSVYISSSILESLRCVPASGPRRLFALLSFSPSPPLVPRSTPQCPRILNSPPVSPPPNRTLAPPLPTLRRYRNLASSRLETSPIAAVEEVVRPAPVLSRGIS